MVEIKKEDISVFERHETMLRSLKKQVKAIMEESVTRKFVHEESAHVLRLCGTVELCLLDGLKRRIPGFLRYNKIASLFTKIGKSLPAISDLVVRVEDIESSFSSTSLNSSLNNTGNCKSKFLWVRTALTEKLLDQILHFLVINHKKFYEETSIMSNCVYGEIIAALLVGPCALDFTKMKTHDHYWSDPPADELIQRHKLHSRRMSKQQTANKRPALTSNNSKTQVAVQDMNVENTCDFRHYVESLHQNSRMTLLFGKNNVVVQPREDVGLIPGYLSLHQEGNRLLMKWTPNQLMKGDMKDSNSSEDLRSLDEVREEGSISVEKENSVPQPLMTSSTRFSDSISYWMFALSIDIRQVVYLHCHQQKDQSGELVLVGQDGVQWPPVRFPPGNHLLAFLSCLETGLLPNGCLDPPLWSQKGKGAVFPQLKRRSSRKFSIDDVTNDFVFRVSISSDSSGECDVITTSRQHETNESSSGHGITCQRTLVISDVISNRLASSSAHQNFSSGDSSEPFVPTSYMFAWRNRSYVTSSPQEGHFDKAEMTSSRYSSSRSSLKMVCKAMKRQIISRAFYGWFAHCRHLATVRKHLSTLVQPPQLDDDVTPQFVDDQLWSTTLMADGKLGSIDELAKHVYYRGAKHNIRTRVWPFLLGHYPATSDATERRDIDENARRFYQQTLAECRKVESSLTKQRALRTSSSSSSSSKIVPVIRDKILQKQSSYLNDVFESDPKKQKETVGVIREDEEEDSKKVHFTEQRIEEGHIPYSSVSTQGSAGDQRMSVSLKSFSVEDRDEVKEDVYSEDEESEDHLKDEESKEEKSPKKMDARVEEDEVEIYEKKVLDVFELNLHRIDKDVQRCDRNHEYFTQSCNLDKLRNIMCSYVWKNLEVGYMQGMCDLAAPLLILFDDEQFVYSLFVKLMERMEKNFPRSNGSDSSSGSSISAMDQHLARLRQLLQILDAELYEHMLNKSDCTHFHFCYRWFLLDFKRELSYDEDIFAVWESFWAAKYVASDQLVAFFALALLQAYRDIIIENDMDFTDIIKFFNETAETHDAEEILERARNLVSELQQMICK